MFGIRGPDAETKEMALAGEHPIRDVANLLVISEAGGYSFLVIDGADLADPDPAVWEVMESGRAGDRWEAFRYRWD